MSEGVSSSHSHTIRYEESLYEFTSINGGRGIIHDGRSFECCVVVVLAAEARADAARFTLSRAFSDLWDAVEKVMYLRAVTALNNTCFSD